MATDASEENSHPAQQDRSSASASDAGARLGAPSVAIDRGFRILADHQRALLAVLRERDPAPASRYLGALQVLDDSTNPDRLALAAHGIRELMQELPRYFNLPIPIRDRMGDKVRDLRQAWAAAQDNVSATAPLPGTVWKKLESLMAWLDVERPTWKQKTARMLRELDPAGRRLPPPVEKLRVEEWLECHKFFVEAAHHRGCTSDDLENRLDRVERFMLDLIRPRTFENADAIDALIQEGEGNA